MSRFSLFATVALAAIAALLVLEVHALIIYELCTDRACSKGCVKHIMPSGCSAARNMTSTCSKSPLWSASIAMFKNADCSGAAKREFNVVCDKCKLDRRTGEHSMITGCSAASASSGIIHHFDCDATCSNCTKKMALAPKKCHEYKKKKISMELVAVKPVGEIITFAYFKNATCGGAATRKYHYVNNQCEHTFARQSIRYHRE